MNFIICCLFLQLKSDADEVWKGLSAVTQLLKTDELAIELPISADHAIELVRLGGQQSELHNISALIGGIASQEAIKILTHQFIPLDNTYVYNGICGCGAFYTM